MSILVTACILVLLGFAQAMDYHLFHIIFRSVPHNNCNQQICKLACDFSYTCRRKIHGKACEDIIKIITPDCAVYLNLNTYVHMQLSLLHEVIQVYKYNIIIDNIIIDGVYM